MYTLLSCFKAFLSLCFISVHSVSTMTHCLSAFMSLWSDCLVHESDARLFQKDQVLLLNMLNTPQLVLLPKGEITVISGWVSESVKAKITFFLSQLSYQKAKIETPEEDSMCLNAHKDVSPPQAGSLLTHGGLLVWTLWTACRCQSRFSLPANWVQTSIAHTDDRHGLQFEAACWLSDPT